MLLVGGSAMRLLGLIATLLVPAANAAEDDPPYSWTCKAKGYYGIEVSPDGRVTPIVDSKSLTQPISIVIRKRSRKANKQSRTGALLSWSSLTTTILSSV
jgi:hypothetical protein